MTRYRDDLPQLDEAVVLTDGGIETTLIYDDGFELPDFAAFVLLADERGRAALDRYFDAYLAVAAREGVGIVLETPTWRASPDWGVRQGYSVEQLIDVNHDSVRLLVGARDRWADRVSTVVISGCIGPRGDGYQASDRMSVDEARDYHSVQARAFADSEADLVTAITMTYTAEAAGLALAARDAAMPVVVSFTVETDGRLPSGESLADAINAVDSVTGSSPAYYMLNCAHPSHFGSVLEPGADWAQRLGGLRANASKSSHAELDVATELDAGDPVELAAEYADLRRSHPQLRVLGGCCGTSHVHIAAIADACLV